MRDESRLIWADKLKGIGITMVSVGHFLMGELPTTHWLFLLACTINIPQFYFVAGYFSKQNRSLKAQLKNNIRTLLIPYFTAALLFWLLKSAKQIMYGLDFSHIIDDFLAIFLQMPDTPWEGTFWFVPSFFLAKTLFELCLSLIKNRYFILPVSFCLAGLAWMYTLTGGVRLLWNLEASLLVQPFFAVGYLWRCFFEKRFELLGKSTHFLCDFAAVIIYAAILICHVQNSYSGIDFHERQLNGFFFTYIICGASIYLLLRIARFFQRKSILSWVGKNSLTYYLYGGIAGGITSRILSILGIEGVTIRFVVNILGLYFLTMPIVWFMNRFFPWAIGKMPNFYNKNCRKV